ncbi:MAG: redoxin domain-containing protein [Planctomycetota bacterium]
MRRAVFALLLTASCAPPEATTPAPKANEPDPPPAASTWQPAEGREMLGTPAPEFSGLSDWTNSEPFTLAALRGKAVLVRFWTTGCSLCRHTAPALNDLDRRFRGKGLVVLGIHHPKEPASREAAYWRSAAQRYGFTFALAQDQEWATVNSWWLERETKHSFTSATFLVDRSGVIRWLHPGGEFFDAEGEPGDAYRSLLTAVEKAVAGEAVK